MADKRIDWPGRKVLVTGCTGFLGGAVVRELLARGSEVVGLIRDRRSEAELTRHQRHGRVRAVHGRIDDLFRIHSALAIHEINAVFHLTGPVGEDRDSGMATIVEAVRKYDPRTPIVTARPADGSRLSGQRPLPVAFAVARFGEIFGEGDRRLERVVPRTILGLLGSGSGAATGDGPARDFVHVRDAARACLLLAEQATRQEVKDVTFASGWVRSDQQIAALIREVFAGRNLPSLASVTPPNSLDWSPDTSLAEALRQTIEWYRESTAAAGRVARPAPDQRRTAA